MPHALQGHLAVCVSWRFAVCNERRPAGAHAQDVDFLAKLLSTLKWPGGKRITLVMCNSTDLAQQLSGKYSGTVVGCDFPTSWSSPDGQSIYTKMPQAGKDTTKALQTFKAGQMEDATGEGLIVVRAGYIASAS